MTNGLFNTRRVGSLLGQVIIRIIAPPKTASNIGLRKRSFACFPYRNTLFTNINPNE